jgi:hypothetical protein
MSAVLRGTRGDLLEHGARRVHEEPSAPIEALGAPS